MYIASLLIISANLGSNVLLEYSPVITWASSIVCSSAVPSTFSISSVRKTEKNKYG